MNVILFALDTLRADHMSCYGYNLKTTPRIDELAQESTLFRYCIAPGIPTHPGFTTIFTGVHPLRHKVVCMASAHELSWKIKTLPEILRREGYTTIAIDNLTATRGLWFARGFNYYVFLEGMPVVSKGYKNIGEVTTRKTKNFLKLWTEGALDSKPFFM